jgi:hypothetical protein
MSDGEKICGSCRFFVPGEENPSIGQCRRFPPARGLQAQQTGEGGLILLPDSDFALTQRAHWCGEHVQGNVIPFAQGNA